MARLVLNNIINCWAYCIKAFYSRSLEKSSGIHPCYVSVKVLEMSQLSIGKVSKWQIKTWGSIEFMFYWFMEKNDFIIFYHVKMIMGLFGPKD